MYTNEELAEMVSEDGLEYVICQKINIKDIQEPKLRALCIAAEDAINNVLRQLPELEEQW